MKMNYIKFGNGNKILIIIPGISLTPLFEKKEAIEKQFAIFKDEFSVYLFDRRTDVLIGHKICDMAEDVYNKMMELGIKKACIYGVSQGGMIALSLAIKHKEVCEKLVLASCLARINKHFENVYENWINLALNNKKDELIIDMIDRLYGNATLNNYRTFLINSYSNLSDEDLNNFITSAIAFRGFDCYNELNKIECDVLVISSLNDNVTTYEGAKEIAEKMNAKFIKYDGDYGHGVYDEVTDFLNHIYVFLK